jgi:hypothetical protein
MSGILRLTQTALSAALMASSVASAQVSDSQAPCEAFSQSEAVFVGRAGGRVKRWVEQGPDNPPYQLTVTPVTVDRVYLGTTPSVVYLTPFSPRRDLTPGQTYLVYGRHYRPPDLYMASLGMGVKDIERAANDLAFLDSLTPDARGGTIHGTVELKAAKDDGTLGAAEPLAGIAIRILRRARVEYRQFTYTDSTDVVTDSGGRFLASGLPTGEYELVPELPPGVVVRDATSRIVTTVRNGGCAMSTIETRTDGRVRGVLRGPTGAPLAWSVDLVPMDIEPDSTGHIKGMGSVSTDETGAFDFRGRLPGRYYLGVSLYDAPTSYPRTYYPGTTDRAASVPVVVGRGYVTDGYDFAVATVLAKGQLDVTVDTDQAGVRKVCIVPLDNQGSSWSTYAFEAGEHFRQEVTEGQRYQVHAHVERAGGHLESEPFEFTATTGTTEVTLRPDAPRGLHHVDRGR